MQTLLKALPIVIGLALLVAGAHETANASGNGGLCKGTASEAEFLGQWHPQHVTCGGACTPTAPGPCVRRSTGKHTVTIPGMGSILVEIFTCVCIEIDHGGGNELWGWDQTVTGHPTCDAQEWRSPTSGALLSYGCLGPCVPSANCDDYDNQTGVGTRSWKCKCP